LIFHSSRKRRLTNSNRIAPLLDPGISRSLRVFQALSPVPWEFSYYVNEGDIALKLSLIGRAERISGDERLSVEEYSP
jgi:hypothetical protein